MSTPSKRLFGSSLILAVIFALAVPVRAQEGVEELTPVTPPPSAETGQMTDESTNLWFVELASTPTVDGTSLTTVKREKDAWRADAKNAGLRYSERYAFDKLFNGFAINVERGELSKLSRIAGTKAIYPVVEVARPQTEAVSDPEMATALAMTGADVAQSELGYTGKGIRVAVMDTGVDYDHPDLGGGFGPGFRVATGYDFVGDAFSGPTSTLVPDHDPDDCRTGSGGHGTHVAGIVGANGDLAKGGVRGVAPDVTFGAYRVFGCEGSTTADIMIAAMERAQADGMQVLNMSIGSAFMTWPQYPTAAAADRLVNKGMVVVASIGNSGANGLYSAGAPGVGNKVIGVASFDNSHVALNTFTISPDGTKIGYSPASPAPNPPTSGSVSMARTGTPTFAADACTALPAGSLAGKVALVRRGGCTFHTKSLNAQKAGAVAVVLYNNTPGRFGASVSGAPAITIPVVAISDAEGKVINDRLVGGDVTMTWTDQSGTFVNPTGGLISSFSSYGLNAELTLKPDIGAPGGLIRSTYPLEAGSYSTISGTSMSSPHVAGSVALLLQAKPNTSAQAVRSILQNSADPKNWSGNASLGFLDFVHRQGAGMIDIDDAIVSTAKIEPGKLTLGESEAGPSTQTLTIENTGTTAVTYSLSHTPALSSRGNTNAPSVVTGFASAAFNVNGVSATSVTVPAGGKATVNVTVTANPTLADGSMYGGYVVFTPQNGAPLRVPYAGFKGDYQSIQVLTAGAPFNFPWLAKPSNGSYARQDAGATFTLQNGDQPYFVGHFEHQSRRLRIEVLDAATGKNWGRAYQEDYLPRNSTSTGFYAFSFDGMTTNNAKTTVVPDGQYVLKVTVLKALGSDTNPAHTETWTSPVFTLDRP